MKILSVLVSISISASLVGALVTKHGLQRAPRTESRLFLEPGALTEYMAKAHEDKLKAVQDLEKAKNSEIQALKKEIQALKGGVNSLAPSAPVDLNDMTTKEMAAKLIQYQQFMAKYIVDAQQQKVKAVKEAEVAIQKRYEEKLLQFSGSSRTEGTSSVKRASTSQKLYDERNARVSAAARAGKSRWGELENLKAGNVASKTQKSGTEVAIPELNGQSINGQAAEIQVATAPSVLFKDRNSLVAAAGKAGKSRWIDEEVAKALEYTLNLSKSVQQSPAGTPVGNEQSREVSLADRVNLGAQLFDSNKVDGSTTEPEKQHLYDARNMMVAAAAKAGKSRWGEMETTKVSALVNAIAGADAGSDTAIPPEVREADHGLRSDGGVGGPSLAQRINLGSALLEN